MKKMSIKSLFLLIFSIFSFIFINFIVFMARTVIDSNFDRYVWEEHNENISIIIKSLEDYYKESGSWEYFNGTSLANFAMQHDSFFTLYDRSGNLIWTSEHLNENTTLGNYWRNIYPIKDNKGKLIGKAYIGIFKDAIFTERDNKFKEKILTHLLAIMIFVFLFSVILIIIISNKLIMPIKEIEKYARNILNGDLSTEIHIETRSKEVASLISTINKLRLSLIHNESIRKEVSSNISHELRTPLNIMQNQIEAMADGIIEPTPERLEGLLSEISRLTNLIKEIESIHEVEKEDFIPNLESVHLASVITNILGTFDASFQKKHIKLQTSLERDIIIQADKDKLSQLIINLISNSLKYTKKGTVTVRAYRDFDRLDGKPIFEVKDTGIGISDEDKKKIFERFYRVEKSGNRGTGGVGLGLAIAKSITDAHSWQIEIESDGIHGSTFRVILN